jgi:hypothetical protein
MDAPPYDPQATSAEIARLRALAIFSAVLALGALALAATLVLTDEREARAFVVRGEGGAVRARLDEQGVTMHDLDGRPRVQLGMFDGTAMLSLSGAGASQAQLAIDDTGMQTFVLFDDHARKRVRVTLQADGSAGMTLFDTNHVWRARVAVTGEGEPSVTLYESDGAVKARLPLE